jgi:hypothetical protein
VGGQGSNAKFNALFIKKFNSVQKSFKTQATQVGNAQCVEKTIPVTMNL